LKALVFDPTIPRFAVTKALSILRRNASWGRLSPLKLVDIPEPPLPRGDWVRMQVRLGGICGSDLHTIHLDSSPALSALTSFPFVLGHENVGTIAEAGAGIHDLRPGQRVTGERRWTLLVVCLATGVLLLNVAAPNVALPEIGRDLGADLSMLQWVISGYSLALAATLLTGGTLADLLGRRRVFLGGLAGFAAASAACGLAPSPLALVGGRAAQGLAAAVLLSSSLALLAQDFAGADRARALGVWAATVAAAFAIGPLEGGLLTEALGWRAIERRLEQGVEPLEVALPVPPVTFQPSGGFRERLGLEPSRPSLRLAAARNQSRALQHLEVLGDRGLGHLERLRQLRHRRVPGGQPGEDRPPRGIGERRERRVEVAGGLLVARQVHNQLVIYIGRARSSSLFSRGVAPGAAPDPIGDRSFRIPYWP